MSTLWPTLIGVFLGFAFGVGCALAVMYSIFTGGYRAAIRDSRLTPPPGRYTKALQKLDPR
jgi:ABC-type nitrate/sulfonate/bicarbonate transport system permease component